MTGQEVGSLQGGVDARSIHRWRDSGCRRVLHFMHGARFELLIEALSYARITIARPPPSIGWAREFEIRRRVPFPFVTIARRSKKNRWKHFTMDPLKRDIFVENNDNGISLICEIRYVININTVYRFYIWKIVGLKLKWSLATAIFLLCRFRGERNENFDFMTIIRRMKAFVKNRKSSEKV